MRNQIQLISLSRFPSFYVILKYQHLQVSIKVYRINYQFTPSKNKKFVQVCVTIYIVNNLSMVIGFANSNPQLQNSFKYA